jgi:hypothetical protein
MFPSGPLRWRSVLLGLAFLWWLTMTGGAPAGALAGVAQDAQSGSVTVQEKQQQPTDLDLPPQLRWLWELGDGGEQSHHLMRATIAALALLVAFLTVVQIWQIPPQSTSLTKAARPQSDDSKKPAEPAGGAASPAPSASPGVGTLFDSNFSRTVLSGLGGLAAVSFIDSGLSDGAPKSDFDAQAYYFVLFVLFFLAGLLLSAVVRGVGEAMRSRIVLSTPAVLWPPTVFRPGQAGGDVPLFYRFVRWLRYWMRRAWRWLASFRATAVVFVDTVFNVLMGKNQLQTAVFSETITDLHESLLEAAERVREDVHQAVLRALLKDGTLPADLPHQERIRVAISLLSSDESSVYYIAWERGCIPQRFDQHSVAWVSAFKGEARWYRSDPHDTLESERKLDLIYKSPDAVLFDNSGGDLPGPQAEILLRQYYQHRGAEDYEGFIVLPMPWVNRGRAGEHRRGAIHISFKEARYMESLWENLEAWDEKKHAVVPNYAEWKGLLDSPGRTRKPPSEGPLSDELGELVGGGREVEEEILGLCQALGQRTSAGRSGEAPFQKASDRHQERRALLGVAPGSGGSRRSLEPLRRRRLRSLRAGAPPLHGDPTLAARSRR